MYLHLGQNTVIVHDEIIGIFDLDTSTISKTTKKFINENQRKGNIEYTDTDLPRSFVLITENKKSKIKLSRISSLGLKQRIGEIKGIGE